MASQQRTMAKKKEENAIVLKSRVKDLEGEVQNLKQRLDDLRKAKNNTIIKREREVLEVGQPGLGRPVGVETSKFKDLERRLASSESARLQAEKDLGELRAKVLKLEAGLGEAAKDREQWKFKCEELQNELASLKRSHATEIEKLRASLREKGALADDRGNELERLREKLEVKATQEEHKRHESKGRESFTNELMAENAVLRAKVESLFNELSEKEAKWLQNEEEMVKQVRVEWDAKYAKWMQETERKIEELREANLLLKSCLYKGQPKDPDPSSSSAPPDD